MLQLQQWHKNLLASKAVAALLVIWAYCDIANNPPSRVFLGGLEGTMVLTPGLSIMGWPPNPFYPVVCLLAAAIYTIVIFGFLTIVGRLTSRLVLRARSARVVQIEHRDLHRYLR